MPNNFQAICKRNGQPYQLYIEIQKFELWRIRASFLLGPLG